MKKTWMMKRILSVCMVRQAISIIPAALAIVAVVMLLSLPGMSLAGSANNVREDTRTDPIPALKYPIGKAAPEMPSKSIEASTSLLSEEPGDTRADPIPAFKYPAKAPSSKLPGKSIEAPTSQSAIVPGRHSAE